MNIRTRSSITIVAIVALACFLPLTAMAQRRPHRMTDREVTQLVPTGFYFQGQSAPTQMRNASAMRFGDDRYVIAGLVDTSGYSAAVRAKYEGFLITDLPITINGTQLGIGAYGFGFTNDGKLNIMNLAGDQLLSVSTRNDSGLRRPRPLMLMESGNDVRFYSGRQYAVIEAR